MNIRSKAKVTAIRKKATRNDQVTLTLKTKIKIKFQQRCKEIEEYDVLT